MGTDTPTELPIAQELGLQEAAPTGRRRSARLSGCALAAGKRDSLGVQLGQVFSSPGLKVARSPRKSTSPIKDSGNVSTGPEVTANLHAPDQIAPSVNAEEEEIDQEGSEETESSNDSASENEKEHDILDGEAVVKKTSDAALDPQAMNVGQGDLATESDGEPETDLSRLSLESDEGVSGGDASGSETEESKASAEEDFTEASMQLDLLSELPSPTAAEHEPEFAEHREPTPEDILPSIEGLDGSPSEEEPAEAQDEFSATAEDSMVTTEVVPSPVKLEPVVPNLDDVPEADEIAMPTEAELATFRSSVGPMTDITDGLTLTPTIVSRAPPPGRKLMFPSPPPPEPSADEPTGTLYLDDDTALLKDFLTRAAASKASRAEKAVTIARRTSLQNRRDSDVIRQALASPRKVLEDKDPNSPSKLVEDVTLDVTLGLAATPVLTPNVPTQDPAEPELAEDEEMNDADKDTGTTSKSSRRSTRARKTRLPPPGTPAAPAKTGPNKISVRRTDAGEPIVLKRTEAQELGLLTRNNTRKNKQGAVNVQLRLARLVATALKEKPKDEPTPPNSAPDGSAEASVDANGKRRIRWDTTLAYYQEDKREIETALAEAQSLATPDELSGEVAAAKPKGKRGGTSRSQRARGLGGVNGTPAKGLLAPAALLPGGVVEEKTAPAPAVKDEEVNKSKAKEPKKEKPEQQKEKESTTATSTPAVAPAPPAEEKKTAAPASTPRLRAPKAGRPKKSMLVPPTPASALLSSPAVSLSSSLTLSSSLPAPSISSSIKPPQTKAHDPKAGKARTTTPIPLPTPTSSLSSSLPATSTFPKDRKSRLATPRRVKLPGVPVPVASAATGALAEGKENKSIGLVAGTPKKGFRIPVPSAPAVPETATVAGPVESGLPRRRGRKV